MELDNNKDLLQYINKEKVSYINFNFHKLYSCFSTCLLKTYLCLREKFINDKHKVTSGCNVMYHVFWILINYTNNLSATIFLSERAVLLYSEFIIMSTNPDINKDLFFTPNDTDAINFAYKKTLGPLKIGNITPNKFSFNLIRLLKSISRTIYNNLINSDNFELLYETVSSNLIKNHQLYNNTSYYSIIFENIQEIISSSGINNKLLVTKLLYFNEILTYNKNLYLFLFEKKMIKISSIIQQANIEESEIDFNIKNIKKSELFNILTSV
jgi:hypothetical protein